MKQFFHDLFYLPKHEKLTDRSFMKIIISSIAGITLCCLCLVSLTWAWFEDNSYSGRNSISSATFWSELVIEKLPATTSFNVGEADGEGETDQATDGEGEQTPAGEANEATTGGEADEGEATLFLSSGLSSNILLTSSVSTLYIPAPAIIDGNNIPPSYRLEGSCKLENFAAGKYKITVLPQGTATKFGGYLVIKTTQTVDNVTVEKKLYTEQMTVGKEFVFTLEIEDGLEYSISCIWGSLSDSIDKKDIIKNELEDKSDDASKAADDTVSDTDKVVSNDTTEVVSNDTTEVVSNDTSSIEDESVSSTEQTEFSNENSTDTASSTEQIESSDVSSVESEAEGSEESEAEISQGNASSEETSVA